MLQTTWQTGHQRQLTARKALSRPWRGSRGGKHRGPSPPWNMERLQSSVQSPPQPIRASYAIMGASWPRLPPRPSELHRLYVCGRDNCQGRALELPAWGTWPRRAGAAPAEWEWLLGPGQGGRGWAGLGCAALCAAWDGGGGGSSSPGMPEVLVRAGTPA